MTAVSPDMAASREAPTSVSAVLPAYNEVAVIAGVVERTHAALSASGLDDFEVIVVDDGSADGTGAVVTAVAQRLDRVRLVTHAANRGYGGALRSGFEAARCQLVWLLDSDGQFDPADLSILLGAWTPGTFVAGYRAQRRDPLGRRVSNRAFFGVVRALLGRTLRDVNCAFKLFPRPLGVGLRAEGAIISTELVLRARREGVPIVEVAVPHHPRTAGTPTGASPAVVARAFAELWELRADLRAGRDAEAPAAGAPPSDA